MELVQTLSPIVDTGGGVTQEEAEPVDVFISFRFGEAHAEALVLKAALEARQLRVFLSDVSPGGDLQAPQLAAAGGAREERSLESV